MIHKIFFSNSLGATYPNEYHTAQKNEVLHKDFSSKREFGHIY